MLKQGMLEVQENALIVKDVYRMALRGEHATTAPGQFIQIALHGFYLRRPISVCDWDDNGMTIIYKVVGEGTRALSQARLGARLDVLSGLGNGFDTGLAQKPLLIGGGVGIPPLYGLAKQLCRQDKPVGVILGFNCDEEIFLRQEFEALGCHVCVTTVRQGAYHCGLATDRVTDMEPYDYYYTCGPEPMLRAVYDVCGTNGQLSFESRMACGFGACMGCSCKTKYGSKRICTDGPVLKGEEVVW